MSLRTYFGENASTGCVAGILASSFIASQAPAYLAMLAISRDPLDALALHGAFLGVRGGLAAAVSFAKKDVSLAGYFFAPELYAAALGAIGVASACIAFDLHRRKPRSELEDIVNAQQPYPEAKI